MRLLFLDLHQEELGFEQQQRLNLYHGLNELLPFETGRDYSKYFTFIITRDPYSRVVSAFIDQYVYQQNQGVMEMFERCPPSEGQPDNFVQFLEYIAEVPDELRDSHFQTQSFSSDFDGFVTSKNRTLPWLSSVINNTFWIRLCGDMQDYQKVMKRAYDHVFRNHPQMKIKARQIITDTKKRNQSFYSHDSYPEAAEMTLQEIDELVFSPKPQDFFRSKEAQELVASIYAEDFYNFGYSKDVLPNKKASTEIKTVPDDFDWRQYLFLNPDMPKKEVHNHRSAVRHYLEFGQYEEVKRPYKIVQPEGFDWQRYLRNYADLRHAGIDNHESALEHYVRYGAREGRTWLKI